MARARPHSFRVALIAGAFLLSGLSVGLGLAKLLRPAPVAQAAALSETEARRNAAIREALRDGKREYQFTAGFNPASGR